MSVDELISKIVKESELKGEEINELIKKKQEELGGLITPEGAAHIVANELGINLFEGVARTHRLKIGNVIDGMRNVEIVGRILRIYEPREFEKKNGSKSKVCGLMVADETGMIRVVFWGKDVELIEEDKIKEGDILGIKNGYTKENMNGIAEIHIGSRGRVIINPEDVEIGDMPPAQERYERLRDLKEGMSNVNVLGRVLKIYETREFERADKTTGKVANLIIGDDTGTCRVVLWDRDAELVEKEEIRVGEVIKIGNGYVKVNHGEAEVNVGRYGSVVLNPSDIEAKKIPELEEFGVGAKRKEVAKVREGDKVEVRGAIVEMFEGNLIFERKDGHGVVVTAIIDDSTGNIRAVFFDQVAEMLLNTTTQKILDSEDPLKILSDRKEEILGREILVSGDARYNQKYNRLELFVRDVDLCPDPKREVKRLLKELELEEE